MSVITRLTTWSDGQVLNAVALNAEFNNILSDYNGNITNANISAAAAIAETKILFSNTGHGHTGGADGKVLSTTPVSGWIPVPATLTYTSADGHTFVVGTSIDLTGTVGLGDRIQLTNASSVKYFIITAFTTTTLTLYGGTNYTVANSAITSPSYSHVKNPLGFTLDSTIWTELLHDTTDLAQAPVLGVYYNMGSLNLAIPIGLWDVSYIVVLQANTPTAGTGTLLFATLSTSNNSVSDGDLNAISSFPAGAASAINFTATRRKTISLATKTTYYLLGSYSAASPPNLIGFTGSSYTASTIKAVCAYL